MYSAMVTARMQQTKKESGNRILESLGSNASQAINELYDYLIAHKSLPWESTAQPSTISPERLRDALAWADSLQIDLSPEFAAMSTKDARRHRLAGR